MAVVHMVNQLTSGCPKCMHLLRILVLNNLMFNRKIWVRFVVLKSNFLADALSRGQMLRFRKLGPEMDVQQTKINQDIWPVSRLWDVNEFV